MAAIDDVNAKLDAAKAAVDASNAKTDLVIAGVTDLKAQVASLQGQIAGGATSITPADLAQLTAKADAIIAAANDEAAKDDAVLAPAPAPVAP